MAVAGVQIRDAPAAALAIAGNPAPEPRTSSPAWCGLHTRAVTKTVTVIRRLQTFRLLHACSGCFRLERWPGGACTRWKRAALSRRTWIADLRRDLLGRQGSAVSRHSSIGMKAAAFNS